MDLARGVRRLAPAGIAFILAVILFAPATLGGKVLSASDIPLFSSPYPPQPPGAQPQNPLQFDAANVFEPDGLVVRDALRGFRLPVWTSQQSAGQPLLAAQQSAPLFPLTWLGVVFPYWHSLAWIAVLKLVLAFTGTFLLARALRLGVAAGLIAGLAFGFGSYLVDWLSHPHANAYVLLPWLFLAAERLVERRRVRDAGLLALAFGLAFLGGQPESSMLVTLAVAGWVVYRLLAGSSGSGRGSVVALAVCALVLGVGLAAVMLIPFGEALRQSYDTSRAEPALPLRSLLSVVFPEFWGRPDRAGLSVGPANFTERTLYVGALPLLLAVAGLCSRRPRGPQLFFAGLTLVALLVALDTGPITKAVRHIPLLDVANMNRALVLASFALAMLAGYGCERLLKASAAERRKLLIVAAVVAGVPVLITILAHPSWLGDLPDAVRRLFGGAANANRGAVGLAAVIRWLLFALVAILLVARPALWRRRGPVLAVAAIGLVALDLLAMGWGYNPAIPKSQADPARPQAIAAAQFVAGGTGGRVTGIGALEPNTASRWGLRDARGHEDPVVERSQKLWLDLSGGITTALFGGTPSAATTARPLDVFGVSAVVLGPPGSDLERRLAPALPGTRVAYSGPGAVVLA
ncbi:MAG TPA: YfhO family protein, partial [Thermoleophilaceae bacterium]